MKEYGKYCRYCGIALGIKNRKGRNLACKTCYARERKSSTKICQEKMVKSGADGFEKYLKAKTARIAMYTRLAQDGQPLFKDERHG